MQASSSSKKIHVTNTLKIVSQLLHSNWTRLPFAINLLIKIKAYFLLWILWTTQEQAQVRLYQHSITFHSKHTWGSSRGTQEDAPASMHQRSAAGGRTGGSCNGSRPGTMVILGEPTAHPWQKGDQEGGESWEPQQWCLGQRHSRVTPRTRHEAQSRDRKAQKHYCTTWKLSTAIMVLDLNGPLSENLQWNLKT